MPETKEVKRRADDQKSDQSPSSIIKPDDPLWKEYEASKRRLKKASEEICLDEESKDATVMAMRKLAQKKQSSRIIKR